MKLNSIGLRHTLHFADLKLKFEYAKKPVTLILGEQSSGKTAILKHIYQALTWFPARFKDMRTPGVVMADADIMYQRVQSRIQVEVSIPSEVGVFAESTTQQNDDVSVCTWKLYKTLNAQNVGMSKVETQQLEQLVQLYHRVLAQDPMTGLPLIAYYPSDRFVNEINLLSKNNAAVFQPHAAYELAPLPYTTFARFFEWFREVSDIENAQSAQLFEQMLHDAQQVNSADTDKNLEFVRTLFQAHAHIQTPALTALKQALSIVLPEISDIYLEYHPKLQLMVKYQDHTICYSQLSNSLKTWLALTGDLVRRMCLLNPKSLFPCIEGNGILLIDQIDAQLDSSMSQEILERLHQAFPQIQIIATGSSEALLEYAADYQYLKLEHKTLTPIDLASPSIDMDQIYENLFTTSNIDASTTLEEEKQSVPDIEHLFACFQQFSPEQQQQFLKMIQEGDQISPHKV